jgi:hypothetical protein
MCHLDKSSVEDNETGAKQCTRDTKLRAVREGRTQEAAGVLKFKRREEHALLARHQAVNSAQYEDMI